MRNAAAALFAVVFLFAHAATLPRTLEDEDSINFALGVESFDVAAHRPHPPGYPVYIALAKASTAVTPFADRDRRAATGLAIWSVIAGALGFVVLTQFWIAAGLSRLLVAARGHGRRHLSAVLVHGLAPAHRRAGPRRRARRASPADSRLARDS